ncbi:hypothetical protein Q75_15510 [Bacillus coahuilensis p1.1.43]|uniref:HEAT repeat domain-containing protein n=3 Tax=Bacillus coahuilensis TaxID=408580 RepID=A0A147K4L9_9BACI|nr:HEAT repeat domain-containing protein [Bacillus coahuilensis]KUP04402.1 hypothetical protein Q75_15510 [Bacillus coahuilensis p1.1.43]
MNTFVDKIFPYLFSEEPPLQRFAFQALNETFLLHPHATLRIIEESEGRTSSIIGFLGEVAVDEAVLLELLKKVETTSGEAQQPYAALMKYASTSLLVNYQDNVRPYFTEEGFAHIIDLAKEKDTEKILQRIADNYERLEDPDIPFEESFDYGKRLIVSLIERGDYSTEQIQQAVSEVLASGEALDYPEVFYAYAAGVVRDEQMIPQLVGILSRQGEELAQQEAMHALIKIGSDEVVDAVAPLVLEEGDFSVEVLTKIKTKRSRDVLYEKFIACEDPTLKTILADSLCQQLAVEGIDDIILFMEEGYDTGMLLLEESVYGCCVVCEVEHEKMSDWKVTIESTSM